MKENKMNINWYPRSYEKDQRTNNSRFKVN